MDGTTENDWQITVLPGIGEIDTASWDSCAGAGNPFLSHAFLASLEDSGSVAARTGWQPQHLVLRNDAGSVLGAVPLYLKSHSYGEYVFDHGWAHAFERAGGDYYPKLQSSVPFTPATGPRLLLKPGQEKPEAAARALIAGLEQLTGRLGVSSCHVTFPLRDDYERFGAAGWLQRVGVQFHWHNHGYASFDDFLATLSSRKRKAIRKERQKVAESDVELVTLTGDDLTPSVFDAFYRFYLDTSDRKWGAAYLNREFFDLIGQRLPERVVLVMGRHDGEWVAGALNLMGSDTLYGRNWGCVERVKFLHFEACYYRAIDFAIERGLSRVEAGAQGPHKIQRGYVPVETYSAHYIPHDGFRAAVADFLESERRHMQQEIDWLMRESPYRQSKE